MIPTPLANGFCFGEGPRWFEGLLWFSDMLGEAVHTVDLAGVMTTLPLPGRSPSGLGFRPDGSLLIVSTEDRQVLRYDGDTVTTVVDLSDVTPASLGDMVVDEAGRAFVGSQARDGGVVVRIDPDDTISVVAEDLDFPNGMVITPEGTLIVAESTGRRLTEFTIGADGELSDRRVFADGLDGPPDGITLDAAGRRLDVDDARAPVRADHPRRQRHRSHRHGRSQRDRVHARRARRPHPVPAVEHRLLSRPAGRHQAVPRRRSDRRHSRRRPP